MTNGNVLHLGQDNFDDAVLRADRPVLVDFHADWCPPCRVLGPIVDDIAAELGQRARIAKVDIDQSPALAERYGISSIPTVLIFRDGEVVDRFVGLTERDELVRALGVAV